MTRLYRTLLWLYPSGFRREYADEMTDIFASDAAATGVLVGVLVLVALRDAP